MDTITIGQLQEKLAALIAGGVKPDRPIQVWLPGSTIRLSEVFLTVGEKGSFVNIEGNINPGSALSDT